MEAEIIDGKHISQHARQEIKKQVQQLAKDSISPSLAVVIVGDNPASHSYIRAKQNACQEAGIATSDKHFSTSVTERELLAHIETLNRNPKVDGILVQLPLPTHINEHAVLCAINPEKDVDGFHPYNIGLLMLGKPRFEPCTPRGIIHLLDVCGVRLPSANIVIVGRSNIVGKPLALMLLRKAKNRNATVTICHSASKGIAEHTRRADIVIAAMGSPNAITPEMIKQGAVIVDVGVNRIPDTSRESGYRLCGDVEFDGVRQVASKITPVPGGVGPMTIAMLLQNTIVSAQRRAS